MTAAELLSAAAFAEGRYAQAFPSFGSERTGAPVMAFCRIDHKPIRLREPVLNPDALIIQDATLLHQVDLFGGLADGGAVLLNSSRDLAGAGLERYRIVTIPASELALKHVGRPVPNAALLGAFAAVTGVLSLESVVAAIREKFPTAIAEKNIAAATEAHEIAARRREAAHA